MKFIWISGLVCLLAGCAASPEGPKEQTALEVQWNVAKDANQDTNFRASPILVKVYELKNTSVFEQADFFSLLDQDKVILGDEMLSKEEFILRPGESKKWQKYSHPETKALGFIAGYQDLARAKWRVVHPLPEAKTAAWYRFMIPRNRVQVVLQVEQSGLILEEVH